MVYIYNEILLSHEKEFLAICKNMGGLGGFYAKWNKSVRERQIWYHLYVESKKFNKLVNITKKEKTHRYREQISGYRWGNRMGRDNIGIGD